MAYNAEDAYNHLEESRYLKWLQGRRDLIDATIEARREAWLLYCQYNDGPIESANSRHLVDLPYVI